jgi:nitrogen regulatory protein PII-like uncharacterized protein
MKVMVTGSFIDKYTGEVRDLGTVFECTEERFAEIQSVSEDFVKAVKEEPVVQKEVQEEVKTEEPEKKPARKRTTKKQKGE